MQRQDTKLNPPNDQLISIEFLLDAYFPGYWYWELVETFQRIFLIGFLALVAQGSYFQMIVGVCFVSLYILLYSLHRPFMDERIHKLKYRLEWQYGCVLLLGLILKMGIMSPYESIINLILLWLIIGNVVIEVALLLWEIIQIKCGWKSIFNDTNVVRSVQLSIDVKSPLVVEDSNRAHSTEIGILVM